MKISRKLKAMASFIFPCQNLVLIITAASLSTKEFNLKSSFDRNHLLSAHIYLNSTLEFVDM